jgi:hypothetical protein
MDTIVAKIRKNSREDVWITRGIYHGKEVVHVRIYYRDTAGVFATRKGIAVSPADVPKLTAALNRAVDGKASEQKPDVIAKNARERINVYAAEFAGHPLIHVRTYYHDADDGAWKPTPKGVAISPDSIPRLIEALESAEQVA